MDYSGIESVDLADVHTLNQTFLAYLAGPEGGRLRSTLPSSLRSAVCKMADRHAERLASVPFLLMSCREQDSAYWQDLVQEQSVRDLFAPANDQDPVSQIAAATLGFLWQLSRRNPYSLRILTGAPMHWCEQLAGSSLFDVLQRAAIDPQLIRLRHASDAVFWQRLLGPGLSSNLEIRRAAHICALQAVLTPGDETRHTRLRSAACHTHVPTMQLHNVRDK